MLISYETIKKVIDNTFSFFCREEITGKDHVPKEGPVILTCNHVSQMEIMLLAGKFDRKVSYLAKKELFAGGNWLKDYFSRQLTEWGTIEIDRSKGDIGALKSCIELLKDEKVLAMFPEGTRSKDGKLGEFKHGLAFIVEKLYEQKIDVPVIPIGVKGTRELQNLLVLIPKLKKYSLHIGKPLYYRDYAVEDRKEGIKIFTAALKEKISYLIDCKE